MQAERIHVPITMNIRSYIALILVGGLLLLCPFAEAAGGRGRIVWTKKASRKSGLYTTQNYFVSHGVGVTASAMYYFGDVDNEGVAFHGGFNIKNLSLGGGLNFFYNLPAGNHCNIRFALMAGTIRGNNEQKFKSLSEPRDDYRKFQATLIQPAVGVQYYPLSNAGLFLYGGFGLAASIINKYQFYYYKSTSAGQEKHCVEGKTYGILPMIQLGLGYSWKLTESWSMSAEIMVNEGLADAHYMNLDGWPMAKSQNSDQVELGGKGLTYINRHGKKTIHWNDGWFQVGITVTYHWRNCEYCRLINNYYNIKPRRR